MIVGCTNCAARLRVNETAQGMAIRCPKCGTVFRIPVAPPATETVTISPAENPSPPARPVARSATVKQTNTDEPIKPAKPKKFKRKKKQTNTTLLVVIGASVVLGLALLGGGGFALWYFFTRKTADQAVTEFLDIMESFVGAVEKVSDPNQRPQAIRELDSSNQRLERWINTYRDCEWPDEEFKQALQKHEVRGKSLAERAVKAGMALAFNKQLQQDQEFVGALKRFGDTLSKIGQMRQKVISPPPMLKPAPLPAPRPPSGIFPGR